MITVVGEALIDLVDTGDHVSFQAHCGGSPFNVAIGLARLEQPTALMARLSVDTFGQLLRAEALRSGVDVGASPLAPEPSSLAFVLLDAAGEAHYEFRINETADWRWSAIELRAVPVETQILHTGSLASWLAPGDTEIAALVGRLRATGAVLISYDPNVRPDLMGTHSQAQARIEANVAAAHVVKASEQDLAWLYPGLPPDSVAAAWLGLGARLVVISRGPHGASAYLAGRRPIHQRGIAVDVVDTVGAGDAFMAGLLAALAEAGIRSPAALDEVEDDNVLGELIQQAIQVAALTCEQAGANPPTLAELIQARQRLSRLASA